MPEIEILDGCDVREPWESNPTWRGATCATIIYHAQDGDEEYNGWYTLSGGEDWRDMDPATVRAEQEEHRDEMLTAAIAAFREAHPA